MKNLKNIIKKIVFRNGIIGINHIAKGKVIVISIIHMILIHMITIIIIISLMIIIHLRIKGKAK